MVNININKSYYEILQVEKTATPDAIRHAYRRQALLHHPDKKPDRDDRMFKEIQEAYETLSDPMRRGIYDTTYDGNVTNINWKEYINYIVVITTNLFASMIDAKRRDVNITIPISMNDLYHGKIKKVIVKVKRLQENLKLESISIPIFISLIDYDSEYVVKNQGDDGLLKKFARGDLKVCIKLQEESYSKRLRIDQLFCKHDLYYDRDITLYEHYFIKSFNIELFDDFILTVPYDHKKVVMLKGKGLPYIDDYGYEQRGDLYVCFHVILPKPDLCNMVDVDQFSACLKKYFNNENEESSELLENYS